MKILAVTQARYSSSRLPGKVLLKAGGRSFLDIHLTRVLKSKLITGLVVATTHEPEASEIVATAARRQCTAFQGSLNDVLDRFYNACIPENPDWVVRLTSDCPLIDPDLIDDLIQKCMKNSVDYASNCLNPTLPDGMDAEIFRMTALEEAWKNAKKLSQREHVTPYIRDSGHFQLFSVEYQPDRSQIRLTLDTPEDYQLLKNVIESCGPDADLQTYLNYLAVHPEVQNLNSTLRRNEGYRKSLKGESI